MKDKQDDILKILDALDDTQHVDEHLQTLLDSEEGREAMRNILDLDEAVNREMGTTPDVEAAWQQFNKKQRKINLIPVLRYIAACAAIVVVALVFMYDNRSSANQQVAQTIEKIETQEAERPSLLDKIKNISLLPARTITVVAKEQKDVTLPDGSTVCMNANSTLKYKENFGTANRNIQFYGEGYFKVRRNASLPFIIKTKTVQTKVLGTEFNLRCYDAEDVHVTLVKGSVEVAMDSEKVRIAPNQDAYLAEGSVKVQDVNPKDFTSWREGILYFDNATLRTILQQLGKVYNVNVVCRDKQLLDKHYHFMCSVNDSLDEVLHLLNITSDINVKLRDNAIVIE